MAVNLYNTLNRSVEPLAQTSDSYKIYCCGPTVYNYAHIGNFRTFLLQDVLFRLLKSQGYNICIARNITDIDDKTIKFSQQKSLSLSEFTKKWERIFHEDCEKLNLLHPDFEPRASEHINEQINLIQTLINKNLAYKSTDGSVYFCIKNFPQYGCLSRVNDRNLQTQNLDSAGKPNQADEYDRDSANDFVLWKAKKPEDGDSFWQSPFGEGRPGWHIECSAMSMKYLGDQIDLHSGGMDLCFPHHENEIAQSEGCTGKTFVKHWMHIAHLLVDGTKMSKSLGNLFTLNDILENGYSAQTLRYALIAGHYRQPLNFAFNTLNSSENALKKIKNFAEKIKFTQQHITSFLTNCVFFNSVIEALCSDLNIPKALGEFFKIIGNVDTKTMSDELKFKISEELQIILYILGIDLSKMEQPKAATFAPQMILDLADERILAKKSKDFESADELRTKINNLGWDIKDTENSYKLSKKTSGQ